MTEDRIAKQRQVARVRLIPLHRNASQPGRVMDIALAVLGSGDGADLILASSKVDASHAAIIQLGKTAYLADLGAPGGTTLNGRRLRWSRLAQGDEIGIGPFRFGVDLDEPNGPATSEEPVFSLRNDQTIGAITSIDPLLLVGSDPGCDVVLRHETVAPRHCLVVWTAEGPLIRDLHRRERTRLNGRRVNLGRLVNGDSIGVGPYELIFETPTVLVNDRNRRERDKIGQSTSSHARLSFDPSVLLAGRLPTSPTSIWDPPSKDSTISGEELADNVLAPLFPREAGDDLAPHEARQGSSPEMPRGDAGNGSPDQMQTQETPSSKTNGKGGRPMSPSDSGTPHLMEERSRKLEQRYSDLRARVTAAQHALDERARKLREGLNAEREHLKVCRVELQKQAEKILLVARGKQSVDDAAADRGVLDLAPLTTRAAPPRNEAGARHDLPGTPDETKFKFRFPRTETLGSDGAQRTAGSSNHAAVNPPHTPLNLQERARELAELVQTGREDINRTERRLAALRLDIQRLRQLVTHTRERYHARDAELEGRFAALEKDQLALREEREKLMNRIGALHTKDLEVQTHMKEAETCREELASEAERLAKSQEILDERQRALRVSVQEERVGLRTRQSDLRRKTAELAQATRDRRRLIEEQMAEQEAALERREAEIQVRRTAIEQTSREEIQKTTSQLEEILGIGLGEIDAELEARQSDLEAHVQAMFDEVAAGTGAPEQDGGSLEDLADASVDTPMADDHRSAASSSVCEQGTADFPAVLGNAPRPNEAKAPDGRLEVLVREVEALRETLSRMGDRRESPGSGIRERRSFADDLSSAEPGTRFFAGTNVAKLRQQNATLRGAPNQADQLDHTYPLQPIDESDDPAGTERESLAVDAVLPPPT